MRISLKDFSFILIVRLDSIARLENTIAICNMLHRNFDTNIILAEIDSRNNQILKSLLKDIVTYIFIEDEDPIMHRTAYYNRIINDVSSPYIALWDVDVVIDSNAIAEAASKLRSKSFDVALPYNGFVFETPLIIKKLFLQESDLQVLYRHVAKMDTLYNNNQCVGGAIFIDRVLFIKAGLENERHYGWGNDDFDRYARFLAQGYRIYRVNTPLFHLNHPRGHNSKFHSYISYKNSTRELMNIKKVSPIGPTKNMVE